MGELKKLERSLKRAGRNLDKAISAPVRVVRSIVRGESGTKIAKEVGRGVGGAMMLNPMYGHSGLRKALSSDGLNKITFGTSKEIMKSGQGFEAMSNRQTVKSSFWQSQAALAGKALIVAGGAQYLAHRAAQPAISLSAQPTTGFSAKLASDSALAPSYAQASTSTFGQVGSSASLTSVPTSGLSTKLAGETALGGSTTSSFFGKYTAKDILYGSVLAKTVIGGGDVPGAVADYFGLPTGGSNVSIESGGAPGGGAIGGGYFGPDFLQSNTPVILAFGLVGLLLLRRGI